MPPASWFDDMKRSAASWSKALTRYQGLIYLDLETTSQFPDSADIVQIGILSHDGKVLINQLVNPGKPIPPESTKIHRITDDDVASSPTFAEIYPELKPLINGKMVVIYNANYDSQILQYHCETAKLPPFRPERWIDAMQPVSEFVGNWNARYKSFKWVKLTEVADQLKVSLDGAHDALVDCHLTRGVLKAMAEWADTCE